MSDMSINFDSPTYCYSTKRIQKIGIQTACKTSTIIQITIMQFLRIQGCGKACQAVQTFTPRVVRWYPTLEAALQAIHGGLSAFFKNKTQESPFSNLQHRRSMKITSRRNENWYFVADLMQLSRFEALNSFESPAIQSVWRLARSVRWRTFFKVLHQTISSQCPEDRENDKHNLHKSPKKACHSKIPTSQGLLAKCLQPEQLPQY